MSLKRFRPDRPSLAVLTLAVLALTRVAGGARASEYSLDGHWEGAIEIPGQTLEVDLDFELSDDLWTGDISIPLQGAKDLPLESITLEGAEASFTISGVPGSPSFKGTIRDDGKAMAGNFSQAGQSFPFELTNGVDPAAKALTALAGIEDVIVAALEDWKTPGVGVAVVVGDKVVLAEGYGIRDIENELPVTAQTLFAIGSSTKAFTALTLATLAEEGKMDWDEPVKDLLPHFELYDEYATHHLTPRDMVTHRCGLPRHDLVWYNDDTGTREEIVAKLRYLEPNKELRETWQYNNLMYLTAGYLTETLTGQTWEEAVRARVLDPLGMERTNFSIEDSQGSDDFSQPYLLDDDDLRKVDFRPVGATGPAGSINSSAEEMAQWVRLQLGNGTVDGEQVLSAGAIHQLHTPQMALTALPQEPENGPTSYAFGWFVNTWYGHLQLTHGGNIDGFSALVTFFPNDDVGVVVLSNRNGDALPSLLTKEIGSRILEIDGKDWIAESAERRDQMKDIVAAAEEKQEMFRAKGTKPSRKLEQFAGDYNHPGYGEMSVEYADKKLTMIYNGMDMPLDHWHYDVFTVPESDDEIIPAHVRIVFQTNAEGNISGLTAPFEPTIDPISFERMPDRKLRDPEYLAGLTGEFEVPGDRVLTVRMKGTQLVGQVTGQPSIVLIPSTSDSEGDVFTIEEVAGLSFRFVRNEDGPVQQVLLVQPGGVFTLDRIEEDEDGSES